MNENEETMQLILLFLNDLCRAGVIDRDIYEKTARKIRDNWGLPRDDGPSFEKCL